MLRLGHCRTAVPMVTSASEPRGAVPVHALPLRQRCTTRARPDEVCSSSHGAYRLVMALTLVWCSSAHGTRVCSPTSMFLPRRLRGGSHTFEVGDEFALKMLSSSPSKTFNPAEKAVLSSIVGRSGTRAGWCTLDQFKERLQARLKGEKLVQTRFVFPLQTRFVFPRPTPGGGHRELGGLDGCSRPAPARQHPRE